MDRFSWGRSFGLVAAQDQTMEFNLGDGEFFVAT